MAEKSVLKKTKKAVKKLVKKNIISRKQASRDIRIAKKLQKKDK